jgi:hypothetical protein
MRHFFITIAAPPAFLLAAGLFPARVEAADVAPPAAYGPPPVGYGEPPDYGPPVRAYRPSPYGYAVSPGRLACGRQWQCGPWGCGWRPVCYPQAYVGPYRGYGLPPPPGYYDPY